MTAAANGAPPGSRRAPPGSRREPSGPRRDKGATDEVNSHRLARRLALASLFEAEFGQRTASSAT
jgi:hypothetical protein